MRYDVNISILFPDLPLLRRPAAAVAAGFDAIETWWPFDTPAPAAQEVDDFVDSVANAGAKVVMLSLDLGDAQAGQHGLLGVPNERRRFADNLAVALELVRRLDCGVVTGHVGNTAPDVPLERLMETATATLRSAAPRVAEAGGILVVEALNHTDFPRYGLPRSADAVALAHRCSTPEGPVKILFDLYHVQRAEGDLIARARAYIDDIGHVQVADVPGRLPPGTGEIAIDQVLAEFDRLGYTGYAGLEYHPSPSASEAFAWLAADRRRSGQAPQGIRLQ